METAGRAASPAKGVGHECVGHEGVGHDGFAHAALLYAGQEAFLGGTLPFIRDGLDADEAVLVVLSVPKIVALREELGAGASGVEFRDMGEVGTNPARIIPAWREFVDAQPPGRGFRGIGEPIWASRSAAELAECQRHEALLNLEFADTRPWQLLCPYDTSALAPDVIEEAHRSHPTIVGGGEGRRSASYRDPAEVAAPFNWPLPVPPPTAAELPFDGPGDLASVRVFVRRHAQQAGLGPERSADVVLAVNEIATNSVRYGGGSGTLRVWVEPDTLICEVADHGRIDEPLVGRRVPDLGIENSRGLWIANHLCELVQIRSFPTGSVVRVHMRRP
jgi:anti-sigma regulatory factor (Ser/Thr protein kinase)